MLSYNCPEGLRPQIWGTGGSPMTAEYWEVHEAEFLAEQEALEWLLFEADMATDPYAK